MRVIIPARQSKAAAGQTGYDTQDEDTRQWAKRHGHTVVAIIPDLISGKVSPFDRPNLRPWLTNAALIAQYDGIAAAKMDRYSRGRDWEMRRWAEDHGKKLFIINPELCWPPEPGDLATPIIWDSLINIAAGEWQSTSMRYRRMQKHLRDNGFLAGGHIPFGFEVIPVDGTDHKTLGLHPVNAEYVRKAVARYLEGDSLRTVCIWLDSEDVKPWWAESWSPKSLQVLFRNPILIGRSCNAEGMTILRVPPILDLATWNRLQAEMDRKAARKGVAPAATALLTGIAVCANCFGPMYRHKITRKRVDGSKAVYLYYRCHGDERNPSGCRNMVPLDELEFMVGMHITGSDHGQKIVKEVVVIPGRGHEDEIAEVERDIRELDLDDPAYLEKLGALRTERVRLKGLPATPESTLERETGQTVAEYWESLDSAGRRAFLLASKAKVAAEKGLAVVSTDDQWVIPTGSAA